MKREDIKLCLELAIGLLLIIISFKVIKWLLPFIIVALIVLLIYDSYKRDKSKLPTVNKKNNKNDIREAEILEEKNID